MLLEKQLLQQTRLPLCGSKWKAFTSWPIFIWQNLP